jgi:hypothetical protein
MKAALGLLFVYAVTLLFLVGCSVGMAIVLCWLVPDVEIGSALLFCVISILGATHWYFKLIDAAHIAGGSWILDEEDDIPMREMPTNFLRPAPRKKKQRER